MNTISQEQTITRRSTILGFAVGLISLSLCTSRSVILGQWGNRGLRAKNRKVFRIPHRDIAVEWEGECEMEVDGLLLVGGGSLLQSWYPKVELPMDSICLPMQKSLRIYKST